MKKELFIGLLLCICFQLFSFNIADVEQSAEEADVKAAFIINFTKYIEWDATEFSKTDKFKIGIVSDEKVYNSLKSLSSKKIKNKSIELKFFSSCDDLEECHLLYVSQELSLKDIKACSGNLKSKNTLIIGDKKNALDNGASINFVLVGDKLKFEINQRNLTNNKLTASSQLLNLATTVQK